jgi:hypothetical protein
MNKLEKLENNIKIAKAAYDKALNELLLAENNVYESLGFAKALIEDRLYQRAYNDCLGAYNFGAEEYRQEFIVDNVKYVGIFYPQYDRHNKTYYYINSSKFECHVIGD